MQKIKISIEDLSNLTAQLPPGTIAAPDDGCYDPAEGEFSFGERSAAKILAAYATLADGLKVRLRAYAAAVRYKAEIAGMSYEGSIYPTDRESQAKFVGAAVMAQLNPAGVFNWKSADGFVSLTAAQIVGLASAVGGYVQRCFDKESTVIGAIEAGTMTTTAEIEAAFAVV